MDKIQNKVMLAEKLAYDFRKDLTKNMNEIETHFSKRHD